MSFHVTYFPNAFSDVCQEFDFSITGTALRDYLFERSISATGKAFYCNDVLCTLDYIPKDNDKILITSSLYHDALDHAVENTGKWWKSAFKSTAKAFKRGNIVGGIIGFAGSVAILLCASPLIFVGSLALDGLRSAVGSLIPSLDAGGHSAGAQSAIKSRPDIAGGQNQNNAGGRVPIILGKHRVYPNVIGQYWTEASTGMRTETYEDGPNMSHGITKPDYGHDMYLHMLLCAGYAPLRITKFSLGDFNLGISMAAGEYDKTFVLNRENVPFLTDEDDIRIQVKQSSGSMDSTLYAARCIETTVGTDIMWPNKTQPVDYAKASVVRMTARGVWKVKAMVSAEAFIAYNNSGEQPAEAITFRMYWRAPGTDAWSTFPDATSVVTVPAGKYTEEMRFDLYGTYPNYDAARPTQLEITVMRNRPNKLDGANPTFGKDDAWSYRDQWTWSTMTTITQDEPVIASLQARLCRIAVRIKATDNLTSILNAFNIVATSVLPSMDASTKKWTFTPGNDYSRNYTLQECWPYWKETSNNADLFVAAFSDMWCFSGAIKAEGTEYTGLRKLAYAQAQDKFIAWSRVQDLWRWCNEPVTVSTTTGTVNLVHQSAYNRIVYDAMRLDELLGSILFPARAAYLPDGTRRSIYHDAQYDQPRFSDVTQYNDRYHQKTIAGVITPKSASAFSVSRVFAQVPDQLKITFISEASDYYQSTTLSFRNPYITEEQYTQRLQNGTLQSETVDLTGVTNAYMCKLYAAYRFSVAINRQLSLTCSVGIMHYFYPVGSRVSVSHDTLMQGLAQGRIVNVLDAGDAWRVTLDEDVTYEATASSFHIKVWAVNTGAIVEVACTPVDPLEQETGYLHTNTWHITKEAMPSSSPLLNSSSYAIGIAGLVASDYIIISRAVDANNNAQLAMVQAADAVHDSDFNIFRPYAPPVGNLVASSSAVQMAPAKAAQAKAAQVTSAMTAVQQVTSGTGDPPNSPSNVVLTAYQDTLEATWTWSGAGLKNSLAAFLVEFTKDNWVTYSTIRVTGTRWSYTFNRDEDGYPEAADLATWAIRIKAENIYGLTSADYAPDTGGRHPSTVGYLSWTPPVPALDTRVNSRSVTLGWQMSNACYNLGNVQVQIAKGYSVDAQDEIVLLTDTAALQAYAPALGLDPTASYENYKEGALDSYLSRGGTTLSLTLPLYGQNAAEPVSRSTPYYFRIRSTINTPTEANPAANRVGAWSAWTLAYAQATSAQDIVRAYKLTDTGEKVKIDGALGAAQIFTNSLAAISANLGRITDGAIAGNENNYWNISRIYNDDGTVGYEGAFRVGGQNQYIKVTPVVINGVFQDDYTIDFKVGTFTVTSVGSIINGRFAVRNDSDTLEYFSIDPTSGLAAIRSMMSVGNPAVNTDRLNVREAIGVLSITHTTGTGLSDLTVVQDGAVAATIDIKIANIKQPFETASRVAANTLPNSSVTVNNETIACFNYRFYILFNVSGNLVLASTADGQTYMTHITGVGVAAGGIFIANGALIIGMKDAIYRSTDGSNFTKIATLTMSDGRQAASSNGAQDQIGAADNFFVFKATDGKVYVIDNSGNITEDTSGLAARWDASSLLLLASGDAAPGSATVIYERVLENNGGIYTAKISSWKPGNTSGVLAQVTFAWRQTPSVFTAFPGGLITRSFYSAPVPAHAFFKISNGNVTYVQDNIPQSCDLSTVFRGPDGEYYVFVRESGVYSLRSSTDLATWVIVENSVIEPGTYVGYNVQSKKLLSAWASTVLYMYSTVPHDLARYRIDSGAWTDTLYDIKDNIVVTEAGLTVKFVAKSGHTLDDMWTLVQGSIGSIHAENSSGAEYFAVRNEKVLIGAHSDVGAKLTAHDTAIAGKQATITGAASSIASANLAASMALVSDANGKVAAHASVGATELGYLDGVTSAIQTQINAKTPINTKTASGETVFPVGTILFVYFGGASSIVRNTTYVLYVDSGTSFSYVTSNSNGNKGAVLSGAWRACGGGSSYGIFQRVS